MTDPAFREDISGQSALGILGALITSMAWGATGIWVNLVPELSPLSLVAWRLLVTALLFTAFFPRVRKGLYRAAWGLGLLLATYYLTAVFAFQHAPVGEVSLCIGCAPLFVLLYQAISGRPPRPRELLAVTLTLMGLIVMMWPTLLGGSLGREGPGLLAALCAAALTAAYASLHRALAVRGQAPNGPEIGRSAFLPLGAILMVIAWMQGRTIGVLPQGTTPILAVLGLGLVSTALPTFTVAIASSHLPAFLNTLIRLTTPVFAAGLGWAFLEQEPTLWTFGGGAMILIGLFVQGLDRGGAT